MKKLIFVFIAILMSLVAMPASHSFADSNSGNGNSGNGNSGNGNSDKTKYDETAATVITGTVTNGGSPVNHANVNVTCNGHTLATTTDSHGAYSVSFASGQCGLNSTVTVVATSGSLSGSNTSTVQSNTCSSNVTVINVSVPEFGIIAGISAAAIGAGAILLVRRRNQGENKA